MIFFDQVSKIYPDQSVALDEVTLTIEPGQFVSVVGHSAAGKSTLLKMILAEEAPSQGRVFFNSTDIHRLPQKKIPRFRRQIGSIFQDFRLLPNKTIFENVAFVMEAASRADEEIQADVPHVLELVGLQNKIWNFPDELSGGERQRAAIARAIVNQPELLLADEPTGNLDPVNTHEIIELLRKINELGTTVILTTHNKGVIDNLGRRVVTLERGKVIRDSQSGKYTL